MHLLLFILLVQASAVAKSIAKKPPSTQIKFLHKMQKTVGNGDGVTMTVTALRKKLNGSATYFPNKLHFNLPPPANKKAVSYNGGEKATFQFNSKGLVKFLTVAGSKYKFTHKKNLKKGYFELKSAKCIRKCNNRHLLGPNDSNLKEKMLEESYVHSLVGIEKRRLDTSCGVCKAAVTAICTDGFVNQFKTCVKISSRIPAGPAAIAITLLCSGITATFCYLGSEVVCDLSCDDDQCDPINQKKCNGKCVDKDWCCVANGDTYCKDGSNVCIPKGSTECCPSKAPCGPKGKCVPKNDCGCDVGERWCDVPEWYGPKCVPKGDCCLYTERVCEEGCKSKRLSCGCDKDGLKLCYTFNQLHGLTAMCYNPTYERCCVGENRRCKVHKPSKCDDVPFQGFCH